VKQNTHSFEQNLAQISGSGRRLRLCLRKALDSQASLRLVGFGTDLELRASAWLAHPRAVACLLRSNPRASILIDPDCTHCLGFASLERRATRVDIGANSSGSVERLWPAEACSPLLEEGRCTLCCASFAARIGLNPSRCLSQILTLGALQPAAGLTNSHRTRILAFRCEPAHARHQKRFRQEELPVK
jgi:hypothetical protein